MVVGLAHIEDPAQWRYRSVMKVGTSSTIDGNGMPERGGWSRLPLPWGVCCYAKADEARWRLLSRPLSALPR
jgi:hypothetical protein